MTSAKRSRKISFLAVAAGLSIFPLTTLAVLDNIDSLLQEILTAIPFVVVTVFSIAVLVFGWGIVKYLTAAGDSAKIKEARVFLWWGVIGMFVLAAVFGIVTFIANQLGVTPIGGGTIKPPIVGVP